MKLLFNEDDTVFVMQFSQKEFQIAYDLVQSIQFADPKSYAIGLRTCERLLESVAKLEPPKPTQPKLRLVPKED